VTSSQGRGAAVLFDVDGTLVDTTYLHVLAWSRVFAREGEQVDMARIHRQIGRGGEELVEDLIGRPAPELTEVHQEAYADLHGEIRAFPRAADLLRAVARRGARVVLASSAPADADAANRRALGADEVIHAAVMSGDVERAKPHPDLFCKALELAEVGRGAAVCVGDSTWDVEAAARAGLACIGLGCGGIGADELRRAGAVEVYADPAELLAELDRSPALRPLWT
jgi:HAD superfamily hydrolase (TIGR01509 family)